jgi:hypothetical protein
MSYVIIYPHLVLAQIFVFFFFSYSVFHPYLFLCLSRSAFCLFLSLLATHNTNIHALDGIQTRKHRKRTTADPRLRSLGHCDRQGFEPHIVSTPTRPTRQMLFFPNFAKNAHKVNKGPYQHAFHLVCKFLTQQQNEDTTLTACLVELCCASSNCAVLAVIVQSIQIPVRLYFILS